MAAEKLESSAVAETKEPLWIAFVFQHTVFVGSRSSHTRAALPTHHGCYCGDTC